MNRESISFKLKVFLVSTIILVCLAIIYSYFMFYNKNTFYPTVNKGRLLTNSTKVKLEEDLSNNSTSLQEKSNFNYTVVDIKGRVLFSSISDYKINTVVSLQDFMEYDSKSSLEHPAFVRYTQPLIINNTEVGSVAFLIPKKDFLDQSPDFLTLLDVIPISIALIIIIILIVSVYIFAQKNILSPIATLNESASKILKGDFSYKIKYDYDTEIGAFCHNFEAMRDELKFSKEKEVAIKNNEKELLACLSHDIKTPLTAIHGYVSGIKDGIVKDRKGIENYCVIILNRIKMLSKLLEDILEHSKAELNKMNITLSEFYSGNFFSDILNDLSVEIESAGIQFIAPKEIPNVIINGDKKRISQVMYNLISNSIKYSKENGTISIYFENTANYMKIYIKDNGIGISSADIPYIFKKFYRGEKSRNQNISGSGLGLSISKYIVEAHGGFINCVQSSSEGTTICFSLPI
jgi:signal transduction histidine kinase